MSDSRSGYDDESLPWLQEVEDEDSRRGISGRAMLLGLIVVLLVAGAVWASFFWMGRKQGGEAGAPELIRAPEQPYKVKPDDPGGLDITGSRTTFQTSAGEDVDSRLNTEATGEHVAVTLPEPKTIPPNETKVPAPAEEAAPKPPPKPSGAPGTVIQLGAFKNVAQAERAWTALRARFGTLSGMSKLIVPYSAGGSSGYRLRAGAASPEAAKAACQAIQAGGESCFIAR
jgi:cell division protein FtsN